MRVVSSSDHATCTVAAHATYPKSGRAAVLGGPIDGVDRFRKRSGDNRQGARAQVRAFFHLLVPFAGSADDRLMGAPQKIPGPVHQSRILQV